MARSASVAGRQEQANIFSLLAQSLEARKLLAEEADFSRADAMLCLKSLAFGYFYEEEYVVKGGTTKKRIYTVKPNFGALQFLLSLTNYDVQDNANAALATVRAVSGVVQQQLMIEQREQSKAITAKTARETLAMDQSYATEEEFVQMGIALGSALLTMIDSIPVSEFPRTEDGKQRLKERLAKKIKDVQSDLLRVKKDDGEDDEG